MINYKKFTTNPSATLQEYRDFYLHGFTKLLQWYYPYRNRNMILGAKREGNERRYLSSGPDTSPEEARVAFTFRHVSCTEQYYFAASVFFLVLIPQVICRVAGREAAGLFYKASGWFQISAGMGGQVSAEQWLLESGDLFPKEEECPYFNALLDVVLPFHQQELSDFLAGEQPSRDAGAYRSLCAGVFGKVDALLAELAAATRAAQGHFKTGKHPTYYLTGEELYG